MYFIYIHNCIKLFEINKISICKADRIKATETIFISATWNNERLCVSAASLLRGVWDRQFVWHVRSNTSIKWETN